MFLFSPDIPTLISFFRPAFFFILGLIFQTQCSEAPRFALLYTKSGYCKSEDKLFVFPQNPGSCDSKVLWLPNFAPAVSFQVTLGVAKNLAFCFCKHFIVPHG